MRNREHLGSALLLFTAIIWGTAFSFQRMGMELVEPISFTAARMTLAAVAVGLAALRRPSPPPGEPEGNGDGAARQGKRAWIPGGICCGCFLAAANTVQQIGLVYTTAGKAGFITALYILLVPVIGFLLFRRRVGRLVWAGVLLGVAGLYLLCVTEGFRLERGDALMCVSALLFTGHILSCDRFASRGDPVRVSALQLVTTSVIAWIAAFLLETPSWERILAAAVPILYCGLISAGLGYTFQMIGQKYTEPTKASLIMSLEAVFAVIAGALLLRERMSPRELLGCAVMFAAIVLVQLPGKKAAE